MQSSSDALNHCQLSFGATTAFGASHTALKVNTFLSILHMQFYDCNISCFGNPRLGGQVWVTSQIGPVRESCLVDMLSAEILFSGLHAVFRVLVRSKVLTARTDTCPPAQLGYLMELCGSTREINEINPGVEVFVLVVFGFNFLMER